MGVLDAYIATCWRCPICDTACDQEATCCTNPECFEPREDPSEEEEA